MNFYEKKNLHACRSYYYNRSYFYPPAEKMHPFFAIATRIILIITSSVFSTGFNNPRGLKFGPDGLSLCCRRWYWRNKLYHRLYPGCSPCRPLYRQSNGSRISRIGRDGTSITFVDNLPSDQTAVTAGSDVSGVADMTFIEIRFMEFWPGRDVHMV